LLESSEKVYKLLLVFGRRERHRAARVDVGGSLRHAGGGLAVEADPASLTFGSDALPGAAVMFPVRTLLS
jgi:hypothetical protein